MMHRYQNKYLKTRKGKGSSRQKCSALVRKKTVMLIQSRKKSENAPTGSKLTDTVGASGVTGTAGDV